MIWARRLKLLTKFGVAALALGALATNGNAQNAYQGKFTLPFETHWGSATLPAGDYTFALPSNSAPYRLYMKVNGYCWNCAYPGFALVAVLTLALGIGANTAITLVHAVQFKSLPVAKPGQLYSLGDSQNGGDTPLRGQWRNCAGIKGFDPMTSCLIGRRSI